MMKNRGYRIVNCDSTIILEKPKMAPYIKKMREKLSKILEISEDVINIKATTTEKLGFCGREEGIAAQSIVLLEKI